MTSSARDEELPEVLARLTLEQAPAQTRMVAFAGASRVIAMGLQFAAGLLVARLLTPQDYGSVALVYSLQMFSSILTELGLASAVIRSRRLDDAWLSTAYALAVGSGIGLALLFCGLGPLVGAATGYAHVTGLMLVAGLTFIAASGNIQLGLLERAGRFDLLARYEIAQAVVSTVVTVSCAIGGLGPYSLVLGPLAGAATFTLTLYGRVGFWNWASPTRECLHDIQASIGGAVGFQVITFWSRNLDNLLLGVTVSAKRLGYYSRAYNLNALPLLVVGAVQARTLLTGFAGVRDDTAALRRQWQDAVLLGSLLSFPAAALFTTTGTTAVTALYGHQWTGSGHLLAVLALAIPAGVAASTLDAVVLLGRPSALWRVGLGQTLVVATAIVVGLPFGPYGVAVGLVVGSILGQVFIVQQGSSLLECSPWLIFRAMLGPALANLVLAGVFLGVRLMFEHSLHGLALLAVVLGAGLVSYAPYAVKVIRSLGADDRGGDADGDSIGRQVSGDDGIGPDGGPVADGHALEDDDTGGQPGLLPDGDRGEVVGEAVTGRAMVLGVHGDVLTEQSAGADDHRSEGDESGVPTHVDVRPEHEAAPHDDASTALDHHARADLDLPPLLHDEVVGPSQGEAGTAHPPASADAVHDGQDP